MSTLLSPQGCCYLLVILSLLAVTSNTLFHKDNPFFYEEADVNTIIQEDGSLIKKLNREQGIPRISRKNYIVAVHSDWEMQLDWYQSFKRSVLGKSDEEIKMEHYIEQS